MLIHASRSETAWRVGIFENRIIVNIKPFFHVSVIHFDHAEMTVGADLVYPGCPVNISLLRCTLHVVEKTGTQEIALLFIAIPGQVETIKVGMHRESGRLEHKMKFCFTGGQPILPARIPHVNTG